MMNAPDTWYERGGRTAVCRTAMLNNASGMQFRCILVASKERRRNAPVSLECNWTELLEIPIEMAERKCRLVCPRERPKSGRVSAVVLIKREVPEVEIALRQSVWFRLWSYHAAFTTEDTVASTSKKFAYYRSSSDSISAIEISGQKLKCSICIPGPNSSRSNGTDILSVLAYSCHVWVYDLLLLKQIVRRQLSFVGSALWCSGGTPDSSTIPKSSVTTSQMMIAEHPQNSEK